MLLGYRYILVAVALGARRLDKSTTYSIAYAFDTAPINVERACRYALKSNGIELSVSEYLDYCGRAIVLPIPPKLPGGLGGIGGLSPPNDDMSG